jgi:hypothetical protein
LKNQLLEEENKHLQTTRTFAERKTSGKSEILIPSSKISKILSDFDTILDSQTNEITSLIADREKLSSLCLAALSLLSHQERILQKFKAANAKLLRFVGGKEEPYDSVVKDFRALGMDVSGNLASTHRAALVASAASSADHSDAVGCSEAERIVRMLPPSSMDDASIRTITKFVLQQARLNEESERELVRLRAARNESVELLRRILPKNARRATAGELLEAVDLVAHRAEECERLAATFTALSDALAANAAKAGADCRLPLNRILFWLQNPTAEVDVSREIGALVRGPEEAKSETALSVSTLIADLDAVQGALLAKGGSGGGSSIIRQIQRLKRSVNEMKTRLRTWDAERRQFIQAKFGKDMDPETTWPEICAFLLKRRSSR